MKYKNKTDYLFIFLQIVVFVFSTVKLMEIGSLITKLQQGQSVEETEDIIVYDVIANSPAENAGVNKSDKIISLEGQKIRYSDDFYRNIVGKKSFHLTLENGGLQRLTEVNTEKSTTLEGAGTGILITNKKTVDANSQTIVAEHVHQIATSEAIPEGSFRNLIINKKITLALIALSTLGMIVLNLRRKKIEKKWIQVVVTFFLFLLAL